MLLRILSSRIPGLNRIAILSVSSLFVLVAVACSGSGRGEGGDFGIGTYQSGGVLDGRETSLQAVLDQGRPVVLNFWGGLCPPCRAEMPTLEDAWIDYEDEVVLLGVDVGPFFRLGSTDDGIALLRDTGVTYPAGNSQSASILEDFNLTGLPATFFMLPDGTIQDSWPGAIASGPLDRRIRNLVAVHEGQSGN